MSNCQQRFEYVNAYYARNQQIVDNCHLLVAFTEKERGGTWDTIKRARRAGKSVKVIKPNLFFPGENNEDKLNLDEEDGKKMRGANREKGKGPFHIKRVSIGSVALHLKRYFSTVEWADFINSKDEAPEKCGEKMLPDFLNYFKKHNFGIIHAFTQAPKSIRHLDKVHPMDIVCRGLAKELSTPFVEMFKPWDKKRRGCFAAHPEIEIQSSVKDFVGGVVFVLDDVSTTNYTLKTALSALISLEIHAHGVCYVQYA